MLKMNNYIKNKTLQFHKLFSVLKVTLEIEISYLISVEIDNDQWDILPRNRISFWFASWMFFRFGPPVI